MASANEKSAMGNIAIPTGVSQRCNWSITAQFTIVAIEPATPARWSRLGESDRIELIPYFMTQQDALIKASFLL